jgi:hypothetical protein
MKHVIEIPDSARTVLQVEFKDRNPLYLASMSYIAVSNPYNATRYPPLDEEYPERAKSQEEQKNWMIAEFGEDAKIAYVPFLKAYEEWKERNKED